VAQPVAGASYDFPGPIIGYTGGGVGLNEGFGTPDWRLFAGIRYHRDPAPPAPLPAPEPEPEPEPEPKPAPPPAPKDTDGDGIMDPDDKCVDKPEDKDGFEDTDGCPDDDNDKDTVLDPSDPCRDEAGPVENKGCPDKDRDADTVVDRLDNCPDEPGPPENQGCKQKQLVVVTTGSLDILDTILFDTDKARIKQKSYKLLDNIASVIKSHTEIRTIHVIGHTDSKANDDFNQSLSERRAAAVVDYLVNKGVERERLVSMGKGESEPIADNGTEKGRQKNRRVEFKIVDSGPSGQPTPPAPPAGGGPKPMDD
jgi:outer membrane protein OmpA-like peptidoglycan-associated protein